MENQSYNTSLNGFRIFFGNIGDYFDMYFCSTIVLLQQGIKKMGCFHDRGHNALCHISRNLYLIIFGVMELILFQLPSLEEISWLSVVATIMSFAYSSIGLGLSIEKTVGVHACPCFHFFKVIT